jgi:mitochondrial translocator assembly and maintenance protein 41
MCALQGAPEDRLGRLVSDNALRVLLENSLPQDEIIYAFAYGSGVLSQQERATRNTNAGSNLLDFVVVARDAYRFHKDNLRINPDHYAGPFLLSTDRAARITWWQRHSIHNRVLRNPRVYFNVTDHFKYGVVQVQDLVEDLTDWTYLYLAGRMHKPTVTIVDRQDEMSYVDNKYPIWSIQKQQDHCNLPAALSASLLLLQQGVESTDSVYPTLIDDSNLYTTIASLSYTGDPRMATGAEDPDKISKLVNSPGQMQRFAQLYRNALVDLEQKGVLSMTAATTSARMQISWDSTNPSAHKLLWERLPRPLQQTLLFQHGNDDNKYHHLAASRTLASALSAIVAPAARYQSMKGLATAGLWRSWAYLARKLSKGILRP